MTKEVIENETAQGVAYAFADAAPTPAQITAAIFASLPSSEQIAQGVIAGVCPKLEVGS